MISWEGIMSGLEGLIGHWSGESQLFLESDTFTSKTSAHIRQGIQGQFILVSYVWEFEGSRQEGLIIFNSGIGKAPTRANWLDSWHMRNDIMHCSGIRDKEGMVALLGSYSVPSSPNWGWRIELELSGSDDLELRMFNISPDCDETLGVLAHYQRTNETV
jgi:hypothetical protein